MRSSTLFSTGVVALSMAALLTACGGGDGDSSPPVGTLKVTGTNNGTYVADTAQTTVDATTYAPDIRVTLRGTPAFTVVFQYESTGTAVRGLDLTINGSPSNALYGCSTACSGMTLNTASRTLKFTNANLPVDPSGTPGTSVTVNGTVSW